jgi:hypothetical protein
MIRCDQPSGGRRPSRTPASATSIRARPARCSSDSSISGGTPAGRRSPPAPKPRCARPGAPLGRRHAATRQARHERRAARRHPRATAPSRAAGSVRSPADRESCLSSTRLGVRRPPERVRSATSRRRPERAGVHREHQLRPARNLRHYWDVPPFGILGRLGKMANDAALLVPMLIWHETGEAAASRPAAD